MRPRKSGDIAKTLKKKGFLEDKDGHHTYYHLVVDGKKTTVNTYLSHGKKSSDYGTKLMAQVKRQLCFEDTKLAEKFLDCPMTEVEYVKMLKEQGEI